MNLTLQAGPSLWSDAELDETVSAMKWRRPRREPSNDLANQVVIDRHLERVDERAELSAMVGAFYMSRWSGAKPR